MNCADVHRLLASGTRSDLPDLAAHLRTCPPCAELAADSGSLARRLNEVGSPESGEDLDPLWAGVATAVQGEGGWRASLRSLPTLVRVALAAIAAAVAVLGGILALRGDIGVYPLPRLAVELGLLLALAIFGAYLVLAPLHRPVRGRALAPAAVTVALLLPWILSALPSAHLLHPASLAGTGTELAPRALACLVYGSAVGLPLVFGALLLGRNDLRRPRWVLLPVAVGALAGYLGLHLHCPITHTEHLLLGHAPIVTALVLLGASCHRLAPKAARCR